MKFPDDGRWAIFRLYYNMWAYCGHSSFIRAMGKIMETYSFKRHCPLIC